MIAIYILIVMTGSTDNGHVQFQEFTGQKDCHRAEQFVARDSSIFGSRIRTKCVPK